jgi:drug/metabolite transporter (DMT)-like permease
VTRSRSQFDVADAAMLAVALIWAANNIFTKAILNENIGPLPYVFCRFALVTVLLFGWLRVRGIDLRVRREDYRQFLLAGLTGYAAYNLLFVIGLSHTTAFSAAILISLGPIFTMVFAAVLGLEQVHTVQWLGVACGFAGVALFVGEKLAGGRPAFGDLLNLIGAACFAIYSIATRPLIQRYGSPAVTAWSVFIGLIAVTPITLTALVHEDWGRVGLDGWAVLFYAGAFSMLIGYTLWGWAIKRSGVGRTVPYLFLVPIVTGILSTLFLDERLSAFKVAGAMLVLIGVSLARRTAIPAAVVVDTKRELPACSVAGTPDVEPGRGQPRPSPTPGP